MASELRVDKIIPSSGTNVAIGTDGGTVSLVGNNNIITSGNATIGGNLGVGGVLTYEDVTNIDSVGLITARGGIRIGAGTTVGPVSGIVTYFGDGSQLTGIDASTIQTGTTKVQTSATLITNQISGVGIATVQAGGINVTGIVTANSFKGDGSQLTGISGGLPTSGGTLTGTLNSQHILPSTDDTYNLGSTSKRWANIYTNDLKLSNEGKSNDVDGTWGSYTIQEGESDLFLINNRNGKKYKFNLTEVL